MIRRDEIERRATAYLAALIARGNEVDLRTAVEDELEHFDAWLNDDPADHEPLSPTDVLQMEERIALGVA